MDIEINNSLNSKYYGRYSYHFVHNLVHVKARQKKVVSVKIAPYLVESPIEKRRAMMVASPLTGEHFFFHQLKNIPCGCVYLVVTMLPHKSIV